MKTNLKVRVPAFVIALLFMILLISFTMIGTTNATVLSVSEVNAAERVAFEKSHETNFTKYSKIVKNIDGFTDKTVSDIKILKDFNGRLFVSVECEPQGYLIFDYGREEPLEFSDTTISPYKNAKGELLYGGPMNYYRQSLLKSTSTTFYVDDLIKNKTISLVKDTFNEFKSYNRDACVHTDKYRSLCAR